MSQLRTSVATVIIYLLLGKAGFGQSGSAGGTGLAFLKLGVGARAAAMGGAFTVISDDATATYWNPAGLATLTKSHVAITHTEWIQDISNEFLAFAFPSLGGGLGFSFYSNNVGGIERRDRPSAQPIGTFDANDLAFGISYGRTFSETVSAGISMKYLFEKIFTETASGYAFDFGVNYRFTSLPVRLGLVIQNVGSVSHLREQSIDLPTSARAAFAYELKLDSIDGVLLLGADAVKVFQSDLRGNFGAEVLAKQRIAFRLGYQTGFEDKSVSGGFGLMFDRYHLDYGYTPFSSGFGDSHKVSFGLEF
ncbi:PorV/PorQ family protein [bacterium]|nr:PorV/PorQ family protein [bacterium]